MTAAQMKTEARRSIADLCDTHRSYLAELFHLRMDPNIPREAAQRYLDEVIDSLRVTKTTRRDR